MYVTIHGIQVGYDTVVSVRYCFRFGEKLALPEYVTSLMEAFNFVWRNPSVLSAAYPETKTVRYSVTELNVPN